MHNQTFGQWGETRAAEYLQQLGYKIRARNWRTKYGEIDIIAQRSGTLYFFEVKSRTAQRYGRPGEAVTWRKRQQLLCTARSYLAYTAQSSEQHISFGVVEYMNGQFTVLPSILV